MQARNPCFSTATVRRQRGFTLIEIILVVMLIGLIVAFAASRILGGGDRAKVNLAKAQLQTLSDKIEQYRSDTGSLPSSLQDLAKAPAGSVSGWLGPYVKPMELKDPWNHEIQYQAPGKDGAPFLLVSFGRDGTAGGDSVDADIAAE